MGIDGYQWGFSGEYNTLLLRQRRNVIQPPNFDEEIEGYQNAPT
jgi:hypothetical protein